MKDIAFSQTSSLQFRAEFFNLFNRVNFNAPNTNFLSGEFGQVTSAGEGRRVQFGVKLYSLTPVDSTHTLTVLFAIVWPQFPRVFLAVARRYGQEALRQKAPSVDQKALEPKFVYSAH